MKATELRIGNLVMGISNTPEIIEAINPETVNTDNHDILLYTQIEPLPLTEEWLLKFGFEKGLHTFHLTVKDQFIEYTDGEVFLGGADSCISGMCFVSKIQYVHQLQNLFFSLTGTELLLAKNKTSTDESLETKS